MSWVSEKRLVIRWAVWSSVALLCCIGKRYACGHGQPNWPDIQGRVAPGVTPWPLILRLLLISQCFVGTDVTTPGLAARAS